MEVGSWFTRESASGKLVGVVKYKDASGAWRQRSRTFPGGRAEAEEAFREWRGELARAAGGPAGRGGAGRGGRSTVGGLVLSTLERDLALGRIERSTYEAQLGYALNHVLPSIGREPASALGPALVEGWAASLSGLSPSSARIAWNVLRKACRRGARDGLVAGDPFEGLSPPRARPARPAHLGAGAREALEAALAEEWGEGSPRATAALLALYAGLRCGECCALRWRDVEGGALRVRASVGRSRAGGYLKAPKSPASERSFPAPARAAAALAARRAAAGREGGPGGPGAFVCGPGAGASFDCPRALSRAFARLCERRGVADSDGRRATFHVLRHTFATAAVAAGVDVKTLSAILGHARADMTLNVYASLDADAKRACVERLDAWW